MGKFNKDGFCGDVLFSMPKIFDTSLNFFLDSNQGELKIRKGSSIIILFFLSMLVVNTIRNTC